jgi:hypothetical protein
MYTRDVNQIFADMLLKAITVKFLRTNIRQATPTFKNTKVRVRPEKDKVGTRRYHRNWNVSVIRRDSSRLIQGV